MRFLNGDEQTALRNVQAYFTPDEAVELCSALSKLLANPEANNHEHVFSKDGSREISVSLITSAKLQDLSGYSAAEQKMFKER